MGTVTTFCIVLTRRRDVRRLQSIQCFVVLRKEDYLQLEVVSLSERGTRVLRELGTETL